jgi:predicted O-methyltransferase YrrM
MTRADLALHFAELGFTRGAEIGVESGKFAEVLCQSIPGLVLLAVDAWESRKGYRERVSRDFWTRAEATARKRLKPYNALVVKGQSVDVARGIPDGSLDFCYVDADQAEAAVLSDLMAWTPKVRKGGVVSGHDWNLPGVQSAVAGFHSGALRVTDDSSPSWWFTRG